MITSLGQGGMPPAWGGPQDSATKQIARAGSVCALRGEGDFQLGF